MATATRSPSSGLLVNCTDDMISHADVLADSFSHGRRSTSTGRKYTQACNSSSWRTFLCCLNRPGSNTYTCGACSSRTGTRRVTHTVSIPVCHGLHHRLHDRHRHRDGWKSTKRGVFTEVGGADDWAYDARRMAARAGKKEGGGGRRKVVDTDPPMAGLEKEMWLWAVEKGKQSREEYKLWKDKKGDGGVVDVDGAGREQSVERAERQRRPRVRWQGVGFDVDDMQHDEKDDDEDGEEEDEENEDQLWQEVEDGVWVEAWDRLAAGLFPSQAKNPTKDASKDLNSEEDRSRKSKEASNEDSEKRFRQNIEGREVYEERAYLVGIEQKSHGVHVQSDWSIEQSLAELTQLAETAGLSVVGTTYQRVDRASPRTYIGSGKVSEIKMAVTAFDVETVIFDDELSPGQLRNLEKAFGGDVRVCDRTALILDIFSQRAATREGKLQVELAQTEYQLPRLTRMWTHLERQAGGMVKGMGEKQIEVDKRILRSKIAALKKDLESVRDHRQQYRDRRANVSIPVVSLVGYTNAGKSTIMNRLTDAGVLAEDKLFATLDPTTRRVELPSRKECLFTDTVGFIQKLPTQLVAAFRATLEEITESSLIVHVIDVSHPMAIQQAEAVRRVLKELEVEDIPMLHIWNKVDAVPNSNADRLREKAGTSSDIVCLSALTGEGMGDFLEAVEMILKDDLVAVEAVVPYDKGELLGMIHRLGMVNFQEYKEEGVLVQAHVPLALSRQLLPFRQPYSTRVPMLLGSSSVEVNHESVS